MRARSLVVAWKYIYKELAHALMEADKSSVDNVGQQARDPVEPMIGFIPSLKAWDPNGLFPEEKLAGPRSMNSWCFSLNLMALPNKNQYNKNRCPSLRAVRQEENFLSLENISLLGSVYLQLIGRDPTPLGRINDLIHSTYANINLIPTDLHINIE